MISAEVPAAAIRAALTAGSYGLRVLNLAPAPREAAGIVAAGVDWLVVNESEATAVLGRPVAGLGGAAGAAGAAADLARAGASNAVVTAGAAGAVYCGPAGALIVPGFPVRPVDSVGAGDTFVGHPARHPGGQAAPGRRPRGDRPFMAGRRRLKPTKPPESPTCSGCTSRQPPGQTVFTAQ